MASALTTRKDFFISLREKYPKLLIKVTNDFRDTVGHHLFVFLGLVCPLTEREDDFMSKEVNHFYKRVPNIYNKSGRRAGLMFSKHKEFFEKVYPYHNGQFKDQKPRSKKAVKRPFELKSKSQQWRDSNKIAKEEKGAVLGAAILHFQREGQKDAALIVKRLQTDPGIAKDLRKSLSDLDNDKEERLIYFCQVVFAHVNGSFNTKFCITVFCF